jgi:hypothetical protein
MVINGLKKTLSLRHELMLFLFASLPLIFLHQWSHARDAAAYIDGGTQIIEGENPYSDGVFRGGPFGAVFLSILFGKLPDFIQALLILALSVVGVWLYLRTFVQRSITSLFVCMIVVWSSADRTSLDTIQLTGLIMGLLGFINLRSSQIKNHRNTFSLFFISLSTAILLDCKPHVVLPFLILITLQMRDFQLLKLSLALLVAGHIYVGSYFGFKHLENWVRLILRIGEDQKFEKFDGAAHNYWQIVTYFNQDLNNWWQAIPFMAYASLLLVSMIFVRRLTLLGANALAGACIGMTSYTHFYDFVPLVAILFIVMTKGHASLFKFGISMFILLPQNWHSWGPLLGVFFTIMIFYLLQIMENEKVVKLGVSNFIKEILKLATIGILFYFCIQTLNGFLPLPGELIDAITTTELYFLYVLMIFKNRKQLYLN